MRFGVHIFRRPSPILLLLIATAGFSLAACSSSSAQPGESFDRSRLQLTQAAATNQLRVYFDNALRALPKGTRFAPIGSDRVIGVPCNDDDPSVNPPVNVTNSYIIKNAGTDESVIDTLQAYWSQQRWTHDQQSDPLPLAVVSPDGYRFSLDHNAIGLSIDASSPCALPTPIVIDSGGQQPTSSPGQ